MVLPDSHKLPLISWYLGGCHIEFNIFQIRGFHPLWPVFPVQFFYILNFLLYGLVQFSPGCSRYTADTTVAPFYMSAGLGSFPFARHYLGNHFCFLFLRVLRCFSSPGCLPPDYGFIWGYIRITGYGLSHSEIHGSMATSA